MCGCGGGGGGRDGGRGAGVVRKLGRVCRLDQGCTFPLRVHHTILLFRNYRYLQIFEDIYNSFTDIRNSIMDICKRIADIRN